MRRLFCWLPVLVALTAFCLQAQTASPMLRTLDKTEALRGDSVTVSGENLAKPGVASLYLTNGKDDFEVTITEQTGTSIRFTVGKDIAFGRYGLLLLTGGETPMYIEQPVKLNVVEKYTPKAEPEPAPPADSGAGQNPGR